jgi:hypothetical protein
MEESTVYNGKNYLYLEEMCEYLVIYEEVVTPWYYASNSFKFSFFVNSDFFYCNICLCSVCTSL